MSRNNYRSLILFSIRTDGEYLLTDGKFSSPSVRMDTNSSNKFTKLTVRMLAGVLDNPQTLVLYFPILCIFVTLGFRIFSDVRTDVNNTDVTLANPSNPSVSSCS